ncbi:MAG: type II secretion system F family protein [Candidatus Eremiobacteraeota bacterium]|nr:type II secretion system F family protein [Candidatus Eremiobacteraeota bacterium]
MVAKDRLNQVYPRVLFVQEQEEAPAARSIQFKLSPSVKIENLSLYTRQLAAMVNGGISVNRAFHFVARGEDQRLNVVMEKVANAIEGGKSVSQALDEQPRVFGETYIALTKAGETSGTLDVTLNKLARLLEKNVTLKKRIQATFAYPTVIGVVAVGIIALFVFYIVPMLLPMFDSVGIELPWPTKVLIYGSRALSNPWIAIPGILLIVGFFSASFWLLAESDRAPALRFAFDQNILRVPVVGKLISLGISARVLYTMSTMLSAGVMLGEVLKTCESVAGNRVYQQKLKHSRESLLSGVSLFDSLTLYEVFAPTALQMIKVGEETGRLDDLISRVAKLYEDDLEIQLDNLASLIEPLIMAVMGAVVGFVVIASFLPMIQLVQNL